MEFIITGLGPGTYGIGGTPIDETNLFEFSEGSSKLRRLKIIGDLGQYTLKREDFFDRYLFFNGNAPIDLIMPPNLDPQLIGKVTGTTAGATTIVNFVAGTNASVAVPKGKLARTEEGERSYFWIKQEVANTYSVYGTLHSQTLHVGANIEMVADDINENRQITLLRNKLLPDLRFFIRYNVDTNYLEIGSRNSSSTAEEVAMRLSRGKRDWEFQGPIQLIFPGRGVQFATPAFTGNDGNRVQDKFEMRVDTNGAIQIWDLNNTQDLKDKIWDSYNGKVSTGTVLALNVQGNTYNYETPLPDLTYTVATKAINGFARVFINAPTEPTVTGGTKIYGDTFIPNVKMEMVVESPDGNAVEYYFIER